MRLKVTRKAGLLAAVLLLIACGKKESEDDDGADVPLSEIAKLVKIEPKAIKETKKIGSGNVVQARTTYAYDGAFLKERIDYREGGEKKKSSITYERDDGRVTKETRRDFDEAGASKVAGVKTYTYDGEGRVTKWSGWTGVETAISERTIERDGAGRIVKVVVVDATGDTTTKTYDWVAKSLSTKRAQEGGSATETTSRYAFFENGFDDVTALLLLKQREKNGDQVSEVTATCAQVGAEPFKFTCDETSTRDGKKTQTDKRTTALITFETPTQKGTEPVEMSSTLTGFGADEAQQFETVNETTYNDQWKPTKGTSVQNNKSTSQKQTYTTETAYDDSGVNPTVSKFLENGTLFSTDTYVY